MNHERDYRKKELYDYAMGWGWACYEAESLEMHPAKELFFMVRKPDLLARG